MERENRLCNGLSSYKVNDKKEKIKKKKLKRKYYKMERFRKKESWWEIFFLSTLVWVIFK